MQANNAPAQDAQLRLQLLQEQNRQLQEQVRQQQAMAKQHARPMHTLPGFEHLYPGTSNCRPPMIAQGQTAPTQYQFAPVPGFGAMMQPGPMYTPGLGATPTAMPTAPTAGFHPPPVTHEQAESKANTETKDSWNATSWNQNGGEQAEWKSSAWSNGGWQYGKWDWNTNEKEGDASWTKKEDRDGGETKTNKGSKPQQASKTDEQDSQELDSSSDDEPQMKKRRKTVRHR